MDASRFRRRSSTQKRTKQIERQETQKHLGGNTVHVPEVVSRRPHLDRYQSVNQAQIDRRELARAKAAFVRQMSHHMIVATHKAGLEAAQNAVQHQNVQEQAPAARRSLLDMSLPSPESQLKDINLGVKWRRIRRVAFRSMAVSMVLVITLSGLFLSQSYIKVHKVFKGTTSTATALKTNVDPNMLNGEGDGRVNVLVMGRGGGQHTAPDLTDTMMVMSVDPLNHSATLFSIPRDLWVQVPGGGPMKINAAWATGIYKYTGAVKTGTTDPKAIEAGFKSVDSVVEGALGIKIHYNMVVNFDAFKQAVNTVGGITVDVPADLVDPTMAWENNNDPILAKAGPNKFNGDKALMYSRSRATTSDFARAERQRALFLALKTQVQELGTLSNPVKISSLLTSFGNNVATDLSFSNSGRLYKIMKGIQPTNILSASLADPANTYIKGSMYKGQSIIVPTAGMYDYKGIHSYVRTQLKDPYIMKENAKVLILNGSQTPSLATKMGDILKSYGYNVMPTGNTPSASWSQTTIVDLTKKNKFTKNYLENRLGMKAEDKLSDTSIPTNGADFVIIMGSDEVITAQTQSH